MNGLCDVHGIARSAGKGCRAEVLHQHNLLHGIAGRGRQLYGAARSNAVVQAHTTGKHSISVRDLDGISMSDVSYCQATSHTF